MSQIKIVNLQKSFGDFTAVKNSNLTINDKEFFVLLGPSGCGKTTTLRMIAGLELPTSGEIYLGDEEVGMLRASERDIAFVFQLFALYPHMNVRNNLSFPLKMQGYKKSDIKNRVAEAAKLLRIAHILKLNKAFPNQILSVTFTNKAAREMNNRVSKILGNNEIGLPWLGTFHSICAKILRRHAKAVNLNQNFTIIDQDDQSRLIKSICNAENIDIKKFLQIS